MVLDSEQAGHGPNGVLNPASTTCVGDVTIQVDNPVFYLDIDFVIVQGAQNIILPDRTVDGSLQRRICFLAWATDFSEICHWTVFFTSGKFGRGYSRDWCC